MRMMIYSPSLFSSVVSHLTSLPFSSRREASVGLQGHVGEQFAHIRDASGVHTFTIRQDAFQIVEQNQSREIAQGAFDRLQGGGEIVAVLGNGIFW